MVPGRSRGTQADGETGRGAGAGHAVRVQANTLIAKGTVGGSSARTFTSSEGLPLLAPVTATTYPKIMGALTEGSCSGLVLAFGQRAGDGVQPAVEGAGPRAAGQPTSFSCSTAISSRRAFSTVAAGLRSETELSTAASRLASDVSWNTSATHREKSWPGQW